MSKFEATITLRNNQGYPVSDYVVKAETSKGFSRRLEFLLSKAESWGGYVSATIWGDFRRFGCRVMPVNPDKDGKYYYLPRGFDFGMVASKD